LEGFLKAFAYAPGCVGSSPGLIAIVPSGAVHRLLWKRKAPGDLLIFSQVVLSLQLAFA